MHATPRGSRKRLAAVADRTRILKLGKWPSGFYGFVLPVIAYQQDTVMRMKPFDEVMHLPSRCQRRFIEHIEPFLAGVWMFSTRQMLLQRGRFHARLGEFLRRARCGRKPFDPVSIRFRTFTNNGHHGRLAGAGYSSRSTKTLSAQRPLPSMLI